MKRNLAAMAKVDAFFGGLPVYLSDAADLSGGETIFPYAREGKLAVLPQKSALLDWTSCSRSRNVQTGSWEASHSSIMHDGKSILNDSKWILNRFFYQSELSCADLMWQQRRQSAGNAVAFAPNVTFILFLRDLLI